MAGLKYWIWLSRFTGLSPDLKYALYEHFGSPEKIYFAREQDYRELRGVNDRDVRLLMDKDPTGAEWVLGRCSELGVSIITIQDAAYPERLRNISNPPLVLYVKGRLPDIDSEPLVGVVGTRKCTPYGIKMAKLMGRELSEGGAVVVSGLAEGIDSAAAEGALRANGRCIGVLGTAIDKVYPAFNTRLFADVSATGALVSEYPPEAVTDKTSFPARNRIISGLSLGVVIVEAPDPSGSLITADRAIKQGRDLFVVPGNADAPSFAGSNKLLLEGIRPAICGWDVLSEYTGRFPNISKPSKSALPRVPATGKTAPLKDVSSSVDTTSDAAGDKKVIDKEKSGEYIDLEGQLKDLTENQLKIVAVMDAPAIHVDDIAERCGLPVHTVLSEMTFLQIKRFVTQEKGKRFTLNIIKSEEQH